MTRRAPHGALLLEALVSLAILVTMSMAITSIVRDSGERLIRAADLAVAEDLARSALAQIEAGIASPESLAGPVPAWDPAQAMAETEDTGGPRSSDEIELSDSTGEPSGWSLEIESQLSPFTGLTLVSVRAHRDDAPGVGVTLHQLLRLRDDGPEGVGEVDEITEQAGGGRP
ncbi:MAG: hypothetical protein ACIARR_10440 [Phycisphaerales bacterium JB059]